MTSIALVTFNDKISAFVHNYVRNIRNDKECGKVTRLGKFQDDRCCNIKISAILHLKYIPFLPFLLFRPEKER